MLLVRQLTGQRRRLAGQWCGVEIADPYRPEPADSPGGLAGAWQRTRWLLTDPATWRDLLWLLVDCTAGAVLALLPAALVGYGLEGVLVQPFLWRHLGDTNAYGVVGFVDLGHGATPFVDNQTEAWLAVPQGVAFALLGLAVAPALLRAHARLTRYFLAPSREELRRRVAVLTETRTQAVDAQAAELRRIERDLHDGAQARLVALGMNLGMAREMLARDPEAAGSLLAEAQEASSRALTELRDLVRGIHPPVLAERGLAGAVQALALTVPVPVEVTVELPGRPAAPVESAAYFATAEALANVVKHSGARHAWILLGYAGGVLSVRVTDDGAGGADPGRGSGLEGIRRRLASFDGTLDVHSPAGGPTVVTMELPCELSSPKTSPSSGTA